MEKHKQSEPLELVVVYSSNGVLAAEMARGKLESAGIPAIVKHDASEPGMGLMIGEAQVFVRKEDAAQALALLANL